MLGQEKVVQLNVSSSSSAVDGVECVEVGSLAVSAVSSSSSAVFDNKLHRCRLPLPLQISFKSYLPTAVAIHRSLKTMPVEEATKIESCRIAVANLLLNVWSHDMKKVHSSRLAPWPEPGFSVRSQ